MSRERARQFEHQPDHDHYTLLYESREEQFASVAPFVEAGLAAGDRCLYVAHENTEADIASALRAHGVAVDAALESDQLSIQRAENVYLSDGEFDPERMRDLLERKTSEALAAGYDRFRITGEMSWTLDSNVDFERIEQYERYVDELCLTTPLVGLCQYNRSRFPPSHLSDVLRAHPHVVQGTEPGLNCYYRPSAERTAAAEMGPETIDRKLRTIDRQRHVTESLQEWDRCLSLLGQSTAQLHEAEPDDVERIAGEIVGDIVDSPLVSFSRYDRDSGALQPQVLKPGPEAIEPTAVLDRLEEPIWDVFVENETRTITVDAGESLTGLLLPAGQHGVFLVGTPDTNVITESDCDFLRSICGHTEAVLDRVEYERDLEETNATLAEKNEHLERLNRINAVIREISQSIVEASTRAEIEREACELLVQETCVSAAWYGTYDATTTTLDPQAAAGDTQGYLDALTLEDDWLAREPAGRAARSQEPQPVQNIYDEPPLAHWQEHALKRGFQSVLSLPVSFDGSMYGVLSLYSERPETFDGEITTVLDELSDSVGHAINSIQRKRALITDAVTELEVRTTNTDIPIVDLVTQYDCEVTIDDVVSNTDGGIRVFAMFHDIAPEEIRTFGRSSPAIESLEVLGEGDRRHSCECLVTDRCLMADLLTHNAVPQSVHAEGGAAELVLHVSQTKRMSEFMDMFTTKYPSAEIVGRRDREQSLRRTADVSAELEEVLTDRQQEVLMLAFHSGYFERPRDRTAEDIADSLDVSHPTVSRHLREAERRVFSMLFAE